MNIHICNKQQDLPVDKLFFKKAIKALALFHQVSFDELSIQFVSQAKIKSLHNTLFKDPTPTDCISCPIDPPGQKPYCLLGEIFVCPQVAKSYALEHKLDPLKELLLYVIHGFLHLIGYDDVDDKTEPVMRLKEQQSLKHLHKEGLC
jgi:probable rRNA maturation factor